MSPGRWGEQQLGQVVVLADAVAVERDDDVPARGPALLLEAHRARCPRAGPAWAAGPPGGDVLQPDALGDRQARSAAPPGGRARGWRRRGRRSGPSRPGAAGRSSDARRRRGPRSRRPSPSPLSVRICELMPRTSPPASSSGPPELPWLIAASVWIAPAVLKPVSDWIERPVAETTPTERDCSSPNGEPIAATGAPTCTPLVEPSGSGRSSRPSGSTFSSATSANGSKPLICAETWLPSGKRT